MFDSSLFKAYLSIFISPSNHSIWFWMGMAYAYIMVVDDPFNLPVMVGFGGAVLLIVVPGLIGCIRLNGAVPLKNPAEETKIKKVGIPEKLDRMYLVFMLVGLANVFFCRKILLGFEDFPRDEMLLWSGCEIFALVCIAAVVLIMFRLLNQLREE